MAWLDDCKERLQAGLPSRGALLAGVSGGADSVALLHVLAETWPGVRKRLWVLHVHHGLRGRAADQDARLVLDHARRLGFPALWYLRDASEEARRGGQSLEAAGRRIRQECFLDAARWLGARAVLLGHHQDDQAETVLFNLFRGSAAQGLSGMQTVRRFPHPLAPPGLLLIRPLLSATKQDLVRFLRDRGQSWREDRTNRSPQFARNQIRLKVLPWLERNGHPGVKARLAQSAESLARDDEYLDAVTGRWLNRWVREQPGWKIPVKRLLALPAAVQWRVLSGVWDRAGIPQKSHSHLERLLRAARSGHKGFHLPRQWTARVWGPDLELIAPREARQPRGVPGSRSRA